MSRRPREARAAAIFDLDRTLIAGASAPVFAASLNEAGIHQLRLPGIGLVESVYRSMGETALTAQGARLAARATAGWPLAAVETAAKSAVDDLFEKLQPYAKGLIEQHRQAGRLLVMATTSPEPLVSPFADRLGFDAVVATRWKTNGVAFTGSVDGPVVWGRGKLEAVRDWADAAGIDLGSSWAYSDSYYDAPLLDAVGNAVAVNPDLRLAVLARLKGWPIRHFDLPEGVLKIAGRELQAWTRPLLRPGTLANVHIDLEGIEQIPTTGPVIVVFNHRSYFDGIVVTSVLGRTGRSFRFLGKKEVFDVPVVGSLGKLAGGIRVDRSSGSNEPLEHAITALRAGDADRALASRHHPTRAFVLRPGAARSLGRGSPRRGDRCARDTDGAMGHGEGVAAQRPTPPFPDSRSTDHPGSRRAPSRIATPKRGCRHGEDHGSARRATASRSARTTDTDRRGAGRHVPARLQG